MCLSSPKPPPPPPVPPPPLRADEENRQAVQNQLGVLSNRQGKQSTYLTGGLGDPGFGTNIKGVKLLGQAG